MIFIREASANHCLVWSISTQSLENGAATDYFYRMPLKREQPDPDAFNAGATLPYNLRLADFESAMRDVYDFFYDVNKLLRRKNLDRLDDTVRPAIMSGLLSDMITASLAKHSRSLVVNKYFNGHPDLVIKGEYPNNSVQAGSKGVEIKTTRKAGGAVDFHGARDQWLCVFVYEIDDDTEPAVARRPMRFSEIYLAQVRIADFRRNERGELGTRTATLHREGIASFRENWIYRLASDEG
ncbi:MAG: hypothetical protein L0211_17785 [Planctomycetaceae bacterium]|nr:hypothetical protein [Planctomycetaceae bacterium]